jgi:hypothetical protein
VFKGKRKVPLLVFRVQLDKLTVALSTSTKSLVSFGVNQAFIMSVKMTGDDKTVEKRKIGLSERNVRHIQCLAIVS